MSVAWQQRQGVALKLQLPELLRCSPKWTLVTCEHQRELYEMVQILPKLTMDRALLHGVNRHTHGETRHTLTAGGPGPLPGWPIACGQQGEEPWCVPQSRTFQSH